MRQYELIAMDMDGTLLNSKKQVSEKNQQAIARAVEAGKTAVLSTGRSVAELMHCRNELGGIRYAVCASGAYLYDLKEDKIFHHQTIDPKIMEELFSILEGEDVMPYYSSCGKIYTERRQLERLEHFKLGVYRKMMEEVCVQVEDAAKDYRENERPIEKICFFCTSGEERARIREKIAHLPIAIVYSERTSLEINAKEVNKAAGLRKLCNFLHLMPEQIIAIGDADNDREMLKFAGLSAAMGNAAEEIKEICDVVVADNDRDGVAEAIETYLIS